MIHLISFLLSVVILSIEYNLCSAHATITVTECGLVEWLRLIEIIAIASSKLISVQILLSSPSGTVPQLGVHGIT